MESWERTGASTSVNMSSESETASTSERYWMEAFVRKLQQKYNQVRDEMCRWDGLQPQLLRQFGNASSIVERLQVLEEAKNFGSLTCIPGIEEVLLGKQLETLEMIFCSMRDIMNEFHRIVLSLDKIARDANHLVKGGSAHVTKQMKTQIGIWPSLEKCLDGLSILYRMHQAEYILKSAIIFSLTHKSSATVIIALRQLLVNQPNIPKDEVQYIFSIIFPEDIC